jgi:hypothetical protein
MQFIFNLLSIAFKLFWEFVAPEIIVNISINIAIAV